MKNELVVSIPQIPAVTFSIDPTKIKEIKDEYPLDTIPKDLSIKEDYDYVVKAIRVCRESRGQIKKDHKEFKAPFIKAGKTCDLAKNTMLADLQGHEDEFKNVKSAFDNIEKERIEAEERAKQKAIDKILNKIAWINGYSSRLIGKPSPEMSEAIEHLKAETFDWAGEMVESAKNVVGNVLVQLENLYKMQVENENAERLAEEERVKREAVEKKQAEERAIEQKRIDNERAKMEAEKAKLQAEKDRLQKEKDDIERENAEAKAEVERLKAEKIAEQERVDAEKKAELKRIETEKAEAERKAEQDAVEEKERIKADKDEKAKVKKLAKEIEKSKKETINAITKILQSDNSADDLASEIVGKVKDGLIPHLYFE